MPTVEAQTTRITVHELKVKSSECIASFPPRLAERFSLSGGAKLSLKVGRVTKEAMIRIEPHSSVADTDPVGLSGRLLRLFGLSEGSHLHVLRTASGVRLGPVVGILAPRRSGLAKPYQAQTSLFRRVIAAGEELGVLVYVFDFHDIRWPERRVRGYTFCQNRWMMRLYPLPDVVFDRASGVFPGGSLRADQARRRLVDDLGIKLFNTRLGNKMRMYRLMHADQLLRKHLPATYKVQGGGVVSRLVTKHGAVYLKPQNGAQGKGIIRLRRLKKGVAYTLTLKDYRQVRGQASGVSEALSRLRSQVALSGYLVQPDLNLLRINGRICDVRVLVQKDRDGAWHVTGVAVRAGAAGRVISNLHGGGRSLRLDRLLQEALGADEERKRRLQEEIEKLAIRIAEVLERSTPCLGELGVDLGIDRQGRIWIIEANSRTGRAVFRRCGMHEAARLADRRPLLYAMHLAGFTT
ncbi:MAG: YheC/YheD family protein [Limnochordia bacterium]|jgi:glutathione synthase/RimK-type ligase-like ATP-grasp enzyme